MGRPLAHDRLRDHDRMMLDSSMAEAANDGHPVPCTGDPRWTDDEDPNAQMIAALGCAGCPVFTECRTYGLTHTDEVGTLGGLTHDQRRPRRGRPPKEKAA